MKIETYETLYDELLELDRQIHHLETWIQIDIPNLQQDKMKLIDLKFKRTALGWRVVKYFD